MAIRKTNRRYIGKVYKSKVSMKDAVTELSPNSFKLLNLIYYEVIKGKDLEDKEAMSILGVSRGTYFKAKDELKEKGYIRIVQVGSTKYKWYIGKDAISKDALKWDEGRKIKSNREFANLVLQVKENEEHIENPTEGVYVLEGFEQDSKVEIVA